MNRELDIKVAEKVMKLPDVKIEPVTLGWGDDDYVINPMRVHSYTLRLPTYAHKKFGYEERELVPKYSTDIRAAWEVVERLKGMKVDIAPLRVGISDCGDEWEADVSTWHDYNYRKIESHRGETVQEAICKVAIQTVEHLAIQAVDK